MYSFNLTAVVIVSHAKKLKKKIHYSADFHSKYSVREDSKKMKNRDLRETRFCMQTENFSPKKIISTEFMTNDFFIRCDFLSHSCDSLLFRAFFFIASIFGMSWYVVVAICLLTQVRNTSFRSQICFRFYFEKQKKILPIMMIFLLSWMKKSLDGNFKFALKIA